MENNLNYLLRNEVIDKLQPYLFTLQSFKADYIGYREFYNDGTSIGFCSNKSWYNYKEDYQSVKNMSIHYTQELMSLVNNNFDFVIRTAANANNPFLQELMKYDMCNSVILYKKTPQVIRHYAIIAKSDNTSSLNHFINKRQDIEDFIENIKLILQSIFQKEIYLPLRMPLLPKGLVHDLFVRSDTNMCKFHDVQLSSREIECCALLAMGASDKEIASKCNITPRTVSYHISNIKRKIKKNSRFEIVKFVKDTNILEYSK